MVAVSKKPTHQVCVECGKRQRLDRGFYMARNNPLFTNERLPICRDCIKKHAEEDEFGTLQLVLKLLNRPLLRNIYEANKDYSNYIRQINSVPHYSHMTYEDSDLFDEVKANVPKREYVLEEMTEEELEIAQSFWGEGMDEKDYQFLIEQWLEYESEYDLETKAMKTYVKEICLTQLDIRKARENGDPTDKLMKQMNDLFASAALKPAQDTAADGNQETFGTMLRRFEKERPIPQPSEDLADVDNIGKYINTWFTDPMARSLGFSNEFAESAEKEIEKYTIRPYEDDADG